MDDVPQHYLQRHPFGRVPVLSHGAFNIYETTAIGRYIDAAFDGPHLVPSEVESLTRCTQVISILDSYGYHPMVRQVFAHRIFRPAIGEKSDKAEIENGLAASQPVLQALNDLVSEAYALDRQVFTLADCHLVPMIAYFVQAAEGEAALHDYGSLSTWWAWASQRESVADTNPGLPLNHVA